MTRCIAFTGGVGGAKLVLGLAQILPPEELLIAVNTGDDFEHLGLTICPDIDTVLYTLAGISNPDTGWGRKQESWKTMKTLESLGGETWFQLGDQDLALHLARRHQMILGATLTEITANLANKLNVRHPIVPMSDHPVRTMILTEEGEMPFQEYFVKNRCLPDINGFRFAGISNAIPSSKLLRAFEDPALELLIICPSNPFISIDPILKLPGLKKAIERSRTTVLAVSPIVGGKALKGPTAKMLKELRLKSDASSIAQHYGKILDGFVIDTKDCNLEKQISEKGHKVLVTQTIMKSLDDKVSLANDILDFAAEISL